MIPKKLKQCGILCLAVLIIKLLVISKITLPKMNPLDAKASEIPCFCAESDGRLEAKLFGNENTAASKNRHMNHFPEIKRGSLANYSIETPRKQYHIELLSEAKSTEYSAPWGGAELIKKCNGKNWYQLGHLAKTSVIITFIDQEDLTTLLRTVHSIVKNTPAQLLKEIILVEDNCEKEELHQTLDVYVEAVFQGLVRILRFNETQGLIKARLLGIQAAKGEVIVCMDSHMEVQPLWLEPLLFELKVNRKTLATSYLDWIEKAGNKWAYKRGGSDWKTYFDMGLVFGFQGASSKAIAKQKNEMQPYECPVTVGTIWAMDKQFFTKIGALDDKMMLWGGENLDLAIRVWLFGGRVINVPCSHAAHLEKPGSRTYRDKWMDNIHRNYLRFMKVWMEDYLPYFYHYFPEMEEMDPGDLTSRLALRDKAIHNFTWYLEQVFPELGIPQLHGLAWGQVKNLETGHCLMDTETSIQLADCQFNPSRKTFFWSKANQELRFPINVFNLGVEASAKTFSIKKLEYVGEFQMNTSTRWLHWKNGPLMVKDRKLCLEVENQRLLIKSCNLNSKFQKWIFSNYTQEYENMISGNSKHYTYLHKWIKSASNNKFENVT